MSEGRTRIIFFHPRQHPTMQTPTSEETVETRLSVYRNSEAKRSNRLMYNSIYEC